jgi:hypothetical protein
MVINAGITSKSLGVGGRKCVIIQIRFSDRRKETPRSFQEKEEQVQCNIIII